MSVTMLVPARRAPDPAQDALPRSRDGRWRRSAMLRQPLHLWRT